MQTETRRLKIIQAYLGMALASLMLAFALEILNRGSLREAVMFAARRTVPFLCNALLVFASLSLCAFFRGRRHFVLSLLILTWLVFGIVNAIVLRYRMTPFSAEDFAMVPSLFRIAKNYLTVLTAVLIIAALVLLLVLVVILWLRLPKAAPMGRFAGLFLRTVLIFAAAVLAERGCIQKGYLSRDFANLADAYQRYGFVYCFSTSLLDVGIGKPEEYSESDIQTVAQNIRRGMAGVEAGSYAGERPNIIMIQLESFFDPTYIRGFSYSTDPIPVFRRLKEESISGFLQVPVVGAGTSNTEFEILTGMSTDYFGAGEYPYNTVLKDHTVEALPHILKNYGYRSTAIHNNTGTFYNRNLVFAQMGFDTFIPQEYMYDLERTPTNWAKDGMLSGLIMDTLAQTQQRDFIYTITVQSHGRYPQERLLSEAHTHVKVKSEGGRSPRGSLEYYVNQLYEVDQMIGALVEELEDYQEPTVLVMYGDHLPALGFDLEDLTQSSLYKTEYVIWSNFGFTGESKDLTAERLGTCILAPFGMTEGIMPRFHLAYTAPEMETYFGGLRKAKKQYKRDLEKLEYDMLYGDGYIFAAFSDLPEIVQISGLNSARVGRRTKERAGYRASILAFTYWPIRITDVDGARLEASSSGDRAQTEEPTPEGLVVHGENFNEYSKIMIDNKPMHTEYIDRQTLRLESEEPAHYNTISVGQFDENLKQLGKCANSVYYPRLGRGAR